MSATPNAKNADGEASNKNANLQSEYAGNLAKIKTVKRRMDAWDMISSFVIHTFPRVGIGRHMDNSKKNKII